MARSTVLVDFDARNASCDVDFRVMLLVVGLKIGWSINSLLGSVLNSMLDSELVSALDSALDLALVLTLDLALVLAPDSVVGDVVVPGMAASSASLKLTFRLVRTVLLTGSHP
jgi:hypothetical protein